MKVLMMIPHLEFGGAQGIAVGLADKLLEHDHEVVFLTLYGGNDYKERLDQIKVVNLGYTKGFGVSSLPFIFSLRKQVKLTIKELKPDLIHTHLFLSKLVLPKVSIPVVDTQHDNSPWWFKSDWNSRLKTFIEKRFVNNVADVSVCISKAVKQDVENLLEVSPKKTELIYNFVEPNPHEVVLDSKRNAQFTIGVVSRLDWEKKGLKEIVDIAVLLMAKKKSFHFRVVGDGPDKERMASYIASQGVEAYFTFVGFKRDVYQEFQSIDLLLMPSNWEGFGLTAIEASLSGVPVLANNVGGLKEVVIDGVNGYHCTNQDLVSYVAKIELLCTKRAVLDDLRASSIVHAKNFAKDEVFRAYENLYIKYAN